MATVLDRTGEAGAIGTPPRDAARSMRPVSVNAVVIARGDIARETQNHPAGKPIEAWQSAARALVVRELLLQEARRLAIVPEPVVDAEGRRETDEEALVRQLIAREVATPEPDEASCRRIYEQRQQSLRSSDLYEVRHILLPASPGNQAARHDAKRQAEAIIATVTRHPDRFAELAQAWSACPSRAQGGSLGQISRGQTVPEFEAALADASVGEVSGAPVETRYGFHVIAVDRRIDGQVLPFALVHEAIAAWLAERSQQVAIRQYIAHLASLATITGIDLSAPTSDPVR